MVEDDLASTSLEVDLLDLNMLICFGARANGKRIRSPAAGRDREHGGAIAGDCPGISQAAQPRAFNGGLRMLDAGRICAPRSHGFGLVERICAHRACDLP